jgi:hypothetical protein
MLFGCVSPYHAPTSGPTAAVTFGGVLVDMRGDVLFKMLDDPVGCRESAYLPTLKPGQTHHQVTVPAEKPLVLRALYVDLPRGVTCTAEFALTLAADGSYFVGLDVGYLQAMGRCVPVALRYVTGQRAPAVVPLSPACGK